MSLLTIIIYNLDVQKNFNKVDWKIDNMYGATMWFIFATFIVVGGLAPVSYLF